MQHFQEFVKNWDTENKILLASNLKTLYNSFSLDCNQFKINEESKAYSACSFLLNKNRIIFRKAKITPKKLGQFVAIWKRDSQGNTSPYKESDELDFMIIYTEIDSESGQFIFPKDLLIKKGILSISPKIGKRGIRVYPGWEKPQNKLA